jgi:transcription-repair coupling factor (superfamily II helicase)
MIDRFGKLPEPTENLIKIIKIKLNCVKANIAKIDMGARGALVTFHKDTFENVQGLLGYVDRLKGTAKIRPDQKLMISRVWRDPRLLQAKPNSLVI